MPSWRMSRQGTRVTAHQATRKVSWESRFRNQSANAIAKKAAQGHGVRSIGPRSKGLDGFKPSGKTNNLAFCPRSAMADTKVSGEIFHRDRVLPKEPTTLR